MNLLLTTTQVRHLWLAIGILGILLLIATNVAARRRAHKPNRHDDQR